jgi:magnesium transporter
MHRLYSRGTQQFSSLESIGTAQVNDDVIWIDLDAPTVEEKRSLEGTLGYDLPTRDEMKDIEPSSRLYREEGATYVTAALVWQAESDSPELANVSFVLARNRLVTIRYSDPTAFRVFKAYAERERTVLSSGAATLLTLLECIVDRNAEILEQTALRVDSISREVFAEETGPRARRAGRNLALALRQIAKRQNLMAKTRESLVSLGRLASFLVLAPEIGEGAGLREQLKSVSRDISSLTDHASFLMANISFLLDASLGLVNIEQNQIIKIFSVAAVIFLPPTLVASSYGMNFEHMPELRWLFGYPMAIFMMLVSALMPFLWFKRKGWL